LTEIQAWREAADRLRVVGHPARLALLAALADGPRCVTDIHELLGVRQANASQHLAVLRRAQLVDYHEDGNLRCYYLLRPALVRDLMRLAGRAYPVRRRSAAQVRRAAEARRRDAA